MPFYEVMLIFLFFVQTAFANSLTWEACVALAAKNNAQIRAAEADLRAARALAGAAKAPLFPSLSSELTGVSTNSQAVATGASTYSTSVEAAITGRYNLFSGFADAGTIDRTHALSEAQNASLRAVRANVSYDLKAAYQNLHYATERVRLTKELLQRREENKRLVELLFESGRENKGSLLLAEAYLVQARYETVQAENAKRSSQAALASVLGLESYETLEVRSSLPLDMAPGPKPDFKALARSTPQYEESVFNEAAAEAGIRIATSGFLPSLDLTGGYAATGADLATNESRRAWVGLTLTVPLFDGGRDYHGVKGASARWASASSARDGVSRELVLRLERAYSAFIEAVEKLKMEEAFRKAAEIRAEIARKKYNNGLLSFEDWDLIENEWINRQKQVLQAARDGVLAQSAWEQIQGQKVFE